MSKFIQLTRFTQEKRTPNAVIVNVEQIKAIVQREDRCEIILGENEHSKIEVTENILMFMEILSCDNDQNKEV